MAVNEVYFGDELIMSVTDTTATPEDVLDGEVFYGSDGVRRTGSFVPPPPITVDDELSLTSENPVQNKVVTQALNEKGTYSKPNTGIPKSDLASDVQASLGKADGAATPEDVYKAYPIASLKDSLINFLDGADNVPVKNLLVDINPVQDLHGYSNPWPAGGGKNLLDKSTASGSTIVWFAEPNGILFHGGVTYCLSIGTAGEIASLAIYATDKTTQLAYVSSGSVKQVIFTPDSDTYGLPRMYKADGVPQTAIDSAMLEVGSTRSEYAPYSNICPITGWTQAKVWRTGKNMTDGFTTAYNSGSVSEGLFTSASFTTSGYSNAAYIGFPGTWLKAGETYYFSMSIRIKEGTGTVNTIAIRSGSTTVPSTPFSSPTVSSEFQRYVRQVTPTDDVLINRAYMQSKNTSGCVFEIRDPMFCLDSDATYEPYTGTSVTIDLDGTRYGGTLDVLTGVLTVDRVKYAFDGTETKGTLNTAANGNRCGFVLPISIKANSQLDFVCNIGKPDAITSQNSPGSWAVGMCAIYYGATGIYFRYIFPTTVTTNTDALAWLVSNGCEIVVPLAEPQTIQLDPETLSTLLGDNNIWADTGDVSLTYRADPTLYIQKLTGSKEDDMVADNAIASGKYFLVGNRLFKSTAAIAAGAQLTIGTNCVETNLAEALNAINT